MSSNQSYCLRCFSLTCSSQLHSGPGGPASPPDSRAVDVDHRSSSTRLFTRVLRYFTHWLCLQPQNPVLFWRNYLLPVSPPGCFSPEAMRIRLRTAIVSMLWPYAYPADSARVSRPR